MRTLSGTDITKCVKNLVLKAACVLRSDMRRVLVAALKTETNPVGRETIRVILENADCARKTRIPICQDTGVTVVYCTIGQDVHVTGSLERAIQKGILDATREGYLRRSVVRSPLQRINTGTNTPGIIHYAIVQGNRCLFSVLLKGFGCENKSKTMLFTPTASRNAIIDFVVDTIQEAGADACPPYVVGVGIGGTIDKAAELAKQVAFRPITGKNPVFYLAKLEREIELRARQLKIGPLGFGGNTTVLRVLIEEYPTHIAGLPVAVNIHCHALRTAQGSV